MEIFANLADGFAIALTWNNLWLALLGCFRLAALVLILLALGLFVLKQTRHDLLLALHHIIGQALVHPVFFALVHLVDQLLQFGVSTFSALLALSLLFAEGIAEGGLAGGHLSVFLTAYPLPFF